MKQIFPDDNMTNSIKNWQSSHKMKFLSQKAQL